MEPTVRLSMFAIHDCSSPRRIRRLPTQICHSWGCAAGWPQCGQVTLPFGSPAVGVIGIHLVRPSGHREGRRGSSRLRGRCNSRPRGGHCRRAWPRRASICRSDSNRPRTPLPFLRHVRVNRPRMDVPAALVVLARDAVLGATAHFHNLRKKPGPNVGQTSRVPRWNSSPVGSNV